jgi:plasmid replication initiation protein
MEDQKPVTLPAFVPTRTFEPERERHLAVKSNALMEAKFSFNLWQLRIFDVMVSMVNKNEPDFKMCRIYLKHLLKFFNSNDSNDYDAVRRAVVGLATKKVVVPYNDEESGEKRWKLLSVFPTATVPNSTDRDHRNNYVELQFHQDVKPYLLELRERFKMYDIRNLCNVRSTYAIKMFWLLKEYDNLGRREIGLEELKDLLNTDDESLQLIGTRRGSAPKKSAPYKLYGDFKKRVLIKSQEDLAQHCDISFTFEEKKIGNKVNSIVFHIKKNTPNKIYQDLPEIEEVSDEVLESRKLGIKQKTTSKKQTVQIKLPTENPLFEKYKSVVVEKFGVSPGVFMELIKEKSEERLEQAIRITNRAKANGQIGRSVAGFFVKSLREGFTDAKEEAEKKQAREAIRKQEQEKLIAELENLRDEQARKFNDRIRELTTEQPNATEDAIRLLKESPVTRGIIEEKQKIAGRLLEIEDFRQDRMLREFVKGKIFEMNQHRFTDVLAEFEPKLAESEAKLKELMAKG